MAGGTPQKLVDILSREEFQPRERVKSYLTIVKEYLWGIVRDFLQWLGDMFEMPSGGNSSIAPWIVTVLEFMRYFFLLSLIAAVSYLCFLVIRRFLPKQTAEGKQQLKKKIPLTLPSLDILLAQGRLNELLAVLRLQLRECFLGKYLLSQALTDRELLIAVPPAEPQLELFQSVAEEFEGSVFAGTELDNQKVRMFHQRFLASAMA